MATLARPGVDINQVITPAAPTVLTPSLVACVVGPCYQIVRPLADGKINGSAKILTSAVLVANNSTAGTVDLSGLTFSLMVNNQNKSVQFPAVVAGSEFTKTQILNTINAQLTGLVVASYNSNNQLVLKTLAKGPANASLSITNVAGGTAANKLGFSQAQTVAGKEAYTGLSYSSYFADLPSTKTSVSELVFEGNDLEVYRDFNNVLSQLSKTSATQWYSVVPDINTASGDVSITTSYWRRHKLFAKNKQGPKTNVVVHSGTPASIRIPLAHTAGSANTFWPDVTSKNYIEVVCVGPEGAGQYIGDIGNTVTVVLTRDDNAASACAASWNGVNKALTITYKGGAQGCSFTALKNAIQTAGGLNTPITNYSGTTIKASVVFDATLAASLAFGAGSDLQADAASKTFNLAGGQDPVDFAVDYPVGTGKAVVRGSVKVGAGDTAAALGVASESLYVSVDGAAYKQITLTAGANVVTTINAAGGSDFGCTIQSVTLPDATSIDVLEIVSTGANSGADSTLSIKADNPFVIEQLFGGFNARTDLLAVGTLLDTAAWGNENNAIDRRQVKLLPGSSGNYNKRAVTAGEKAVLPGTLTLALNELSSAGLFLFAAAADMTGALQNDAKKLKITHSVAGSDVLDLNDPATVGTALTRAVLVARINTKIAAGALAGKVSCTLVGDYVVISEASGVAGASITIGDVALNETTQNVKDWLGSAATHWGVASTTVGTADLTFRDTGTGYAWELVSVSSDTTSGWKVAAGVSLTTSLLSQLILDQTAAPNGPGFNYSLGKTDLANSVKGTLVFRGQSQPGTPVSVWLLLPTSVSVNASSFGSISYQRLEANATLGAPAQYQGKVFQARPNKVKVGDTLYNNGSVKGKVVGFESNDYAGTTWTNNALVLSDFTVDNNSSLSDWYIVAEGLDQESPQRLLPELTVSELNQSFTVKHTVNRSLAGIPLLDTSAFLYIGYKALRKDVSADTANPGVLTFQSVTEVESLIGPIDPENPLAFAMYVAFLHAVDVTISALGISEVSADSPNGTVLAYKKALDYLTLKEVYALAPLTQDPGVHDLFALHCSVMSEPEGRKERIALVNRALPTEKPALLGTSGTATLGAAFGPNNTLYNLTFSSPSVDVKAALNGKLTANGQVIDLDASGGALTPTDGVFVDREGDPYRYLVVAVPNTSTLTIEVSNVYGPGSGPGTGGNGDSYFRTSAPADFEVDGEICSIFVRQAALNLNTTAGKLATCETLAEIAGGVTGYQNRRLFIEQPEQVGLPFGGTELLIPGYYLCVADAARIAQLSPAQPFTNLPYNGFTRVVGSSDKFSENQMATAAAGGIWWVVQDTPGGALVCRHQLSTDVSTLKTRELSITKSVDYVAKLIRDQIRRFIGRNNITQQLLETIGLSVGAALQSVTNTAVQTASLDSIAQDADNPDTVVAEISVTPFYPCNRIKITIKV